jgi:hypothetical protein
MALVAHPSPMHARAQMHASQLLLKPDTSSTCTCKLEWGGVPQLYPSQPHLCLLDGQCTSELNFWIGATCAYPTYPAPASLGATSKAAPSTMAWTTVTALEAAPYCAGRRRKKVLGPKYCPGFTENKDTTEISRNLSSSTVFGNPSMYCILQRQPLAMAQ